ncbi:MAG: ABC transporter substrate-binding protein [Rickettsiaceae bacterium]
MKTTKLIIAFTALFIAASTQAAPNGARKTLVIAGDYWCPYNCLPNSNRPGFLVELVSRALHIYGVDIEYQMMSWNQALGKVKNAEIDGIIGISNPGGRNLVSTKLPLEYCMPKAFTRNDTDWVYNGTESLRGKKLGIILGYTLDESINNYIGMHYASSLGMFIVEDGENAVIESIANIIDGDSDVYIEDERVVKSYTKENGLAQYIKDAGSITENKLPIYVAFAKEVPHINQYIKYFEDGLASLKATGEYDALRAKYNLD